MPRTSLLDGALLAAARTHALHGGTGGINMSLIRAAKDLAMQHIDPCRPTAALGAEQVHDAFERGHPRLLRHRELRLAVHGPLQRQNRALRLQRLVHAACPRVQLDLVLDDVWLAVQRGGTRASYQMEVTSFPTSATLSVACRGSCTMATMVRLITLC